MANGFVYREANKIVRSCETRDPFKIARELGIHVSFDNAFTELKGMYCILKRSRFIILNGNLNHQRLKTVCAHEIGHDRLHRQLARSRALREFMLYDMKSRPEYEANVFASDLLVDDREILALIRDGEDIMHIARALQVDINLVLIKVDELRKRGCEVVAPYRPSADFLRR